MGLKLGLKTHFNKEFKNGYWVILSVNIWLLLWNNVLTLEAPRPSDGDCKVSGTGSHRSSYLIEITLGYVTGAGSLTIAPQLL